MKNEPIRILCVFSSLDRGGAESMCMSLYRNIDRTKVQFDFVKHSSGLGDFEDEIISLGGRIFEAPRYNIKNHFSYCKWWKNHLKNHPEHRIIHGHFFRISPVYFSVAHKFSCVTIAHSHCTKSKSYGIQEIVRRLFENRIERNADYAFACGFDAGKWLFKNKSFTVIKNAIDVQRYTFNETTSIDVRKKMGIASGDFVLGTVGRLNQQKNPMGIIDIFSSFIANNPNAKLLWIGEGNKRTEIENRLKELGLSDKVILTGIRNDVDLLLQAMDVFILPSLFEGLPVVAIEAQAAGLQCFFGNTVTNECDITGQCHFLPIDDTDLWVKEIMSTDYSRVDSTQKIIDSGYDIKTSSQKLQEFYLSL